MCLTTNDPTIKVAEQDITVYKMLYPAEVPNPNRNFFQRLFGLSKFVDGWQAESGNCHYTIGEVNPTVELYPYGYSSGNSSVDQGYHSDAVPNAYSNAVFVIPKGTKYIAGWYNTTRDRANYVSETIIFKEVLKKD